MRANFSPKQLHAYASNRTDKMFLIGAVRSGKTFVSYFIFIKKLLNLIENNLEGDVAIIGVTERTILRNIIHKMQDIYGMKNVQFKIGTGCAYIFGRRVYVIGANDETAESKIKGMTAALVLIDEMTEIPESAFKQLLARLSLEYSYMIATTNPDSPFHYLKTEYVDKARYINGKLNTNVNEDEVLDIEVFNFILEDNLTLKPKYVNELKREYVGMWYKRFILGFWCMAEGRIYDMFDENQNVWPNDHIGETNTFKDFWVSVDYGTGNPTCFLLWGRTLEDKCLVLREYYYGVDRTNLQKTDSEFSHDLEIFMLEHQEIHNLPNIRMIPIYVDPSAASFIQQLNRDKWRYILRANNKVIDGIRAVGSALAQRIIYIHKSCIHTLQEIVTYSWDEKSQKRGEDKPVKASDHCMDSLRYGYYSRKVPRKQSKLLVGGRK